MTKSLKRLSLGVGIFLFAAAVVISAMWFIPNRFGYNTSTSTIDRVLNDLHPSVSTQTDRMMSAARDRIRKNPDDAISYLHLASACLQKARETGDPTLYSKAEVLLEHAIKFDPDNVEALTSMGSLCLSRHQFRSALEWAERARALDAYSAPVYGVIGDAYVELGVYDRAVETIQKMVDTRPDTRSYARVSYVRELYGDTEGAIAAMKKAANAAPPNTGQAKWCMVQLGNLYFNRGKIKEAEQIYRQAIGDPPYAFASAALAKVRAVQRRYDEAIVLYEQAIELMPEHAFVEGLGDVFLAAGRVEEAATQFSLVRAMLQLDENNGMDIDLELAHFNSDHDLNIDEAVQRARREHERRPQSIKAADVLAWALCKSGKYAEAEPYSQASLRLGTKDASLYFHAGFIAHRLGKQQEARADFMKTLSYNQYFSLRDAAEAKKLLHRPTTRPSTIVAKN